MNRLRVVADLRWPAGTGIGVCKDQYLKRAPADIEVRDLRVGGRIGSPASPFRVAARLSARDVGADLFWNPGFIPPAWSRLPVVVTVHDLTHLHFYSRLHALYYERVLKPLYRTCDAIVCVSEYTRKEFLDWSGADPDRVHVAYNGVSDAFNVSVAPFRARAPYIFYPGNKRSYKNLSTLLKAFQVSSLPRAGFMVLMTGGPTPELGRLIVDLGLGDSVEFLGHVDDNQLASLYRGAHFTAFISLYEGFGLPIVESMASGTPVLTSNISSMPEVAGDAGLVVSPLDVEAVADAMQRLTLDSLLREELIAKGLLRAARFSWEASASGIWNLARSVTGSRG